MRIQHKMYFCQCTIMSVIDTSRCQFDYRDVITVHDAQVVVKRALGDDVEVLKHLMQPYTHEKIGFLSSHQRLKITVRRKSHHRDSSIVLDFFVKAIPYDIPNQAKYVEEKDVFRKEAAFFDEIMPQLIHKYSGNPWGPQCYLVKNDALVFQDLGHQGFRMRAKLFDETLIKSGLRTLANLHAASMIAEQRLGHPLNEIYGDAFKERAFLTEGNQYRWYQAGVDVAVTIAEQMGLNGTLLSAACRRVFKAMEPSTNKRNVVSHGDLWSNNLMFDDNSPPNCRLVDFQLLRYSPLAHDVAQFLYLCASRHLRNTKTTYFLKYYYETVAMCLKLNSHVNVPLPSWHEILQGYEEQKLAAAITAIMYFPTVLLDSELGAKIMNDSESYAKFVFHDRRDIVMNNMKIDNDYNSRLTEMIEELAEMSSTMDSLSIPS